MNGTNTPRSERQHDGIVILPKLTPASIRARPERGKTRNAPVKCFTVCGLAVNELLMPPVNGVPDGQNPEVFTALIANRDNWLATVFDDDGMPEAVYRSEALFLPVCHLAILHRMRREGSAAILLEFWAEPANTMRGYRWYYHNRAKLDRKNLSIADRLLRA